MKLALAAAMLVAHFTATSVSGTATRTCGTVTATSATYAGSGTTIVARSTIDSRTGKGVVSGTLKTATMDAQFSAVYDHGAIVGTASGSRGPHPFVSSLSAVFSTAGGFTKGELGGRGAIGGAVVLASGCAPPPEKVLRQAQGLIKAANASQITVGGLTCVVPKTLSIPVTFNHPAGTWAAITCSVSNGVATLVTIRASR